MRDLYGAAGEEEVDEWQIGREEEKEGLVMRALIWRGLRGFTGTINQYRALPRFVLRGTSFWLYWMGN